MESALMMVAPNQPFSAPIPPSASARATDMASADLPEQVGPATTSATGSFEDMA